MGAVTYCTVGSNRLDEAKRFYDALLAIAGLEPLFDHPSGGRVYGRDGAFNFAVLGPFDGGAASVGNGSMVAFGCESRGEVDALHAKALALGGVAEGGPDERGPGWYFAYFRDLDGNKLCAYCTR
jgi:catechol 2,3-dioxygenase-like lactoylglutathione lyase family enzyme